MNNELWISFFGDKLNPEELRLLTCLNIKTLAAPGEIGLRGRYKGKPSPYGLGSLIVLDTYKNEYTILKVIEFIEAKLDTLLNCGVQTLEVSDKASVYVKNKIQELNLKLQH